MDKEQIDKMYLKLHRMHHDMVLMCYSTLGEPVNEELKIIRDSLQVLLERLKEKIES